MPVVTFGLTPVVEVKVRGEERDPYCPDDGGLVCKLMQWLWDEQIFSTPGGGVTGGGVYIAKHWPSDAAKIKTWLLENGVVEKE
jgi:hypothetical protein